MSVRSSGVRGCSGCKLPSCAFCSSRAPTALIYPSVEGFHGSTYRRLAGLHQRRLLTRLQSPNRPPYTWPTDGVENLLPMWGSLLLILVLDCRQAPRTRACLSPAASSWALPRLSCSPCLLGYLGVKFAANKDSLNLVQHQLVLRCHHWLLGDLCHTRIQPLVLETTFSSSGSSAYYWNRSSRSMHESPRWLVSVGVPMKPDETLPPSTPRAMPTRLL